MEKRYYEQYDETVYSKRLDNGLSVQILPKKGFNKTYALFTTDYGSIDDAFVPIGEDEMLRVPDGIAHFLEHKLFEKEDGDVFQVFGQQGAGANAYTSFTRTAYLFSATQNIETNLMTLINFVQDPYFTEKTVEKEKGIIAQEILMYDDDPDWRLLFGLLQNLFPDHPVSTDIAGTVESIQDITADLLYTSYHTFYHPTNMGLTVVGNVDPEAIMALIEENQAAKDFPEFSEVARAAVQEDLSKIVTRRDEQMPVSRSKIAIGVRGVKPHTHDAEDFKRAQALQMFVNLLFGDTSNTYLELYDEGIIDDTFHAGVSYERGFDYLSLSGDVNDSEVAIQRLSEVLLQGADSPELTEENFRLMKKRFIGQNLRVLNSVEYIARQLYLPDYPGKTLFDLLPLIEDITLDDVKAVARDYIKEDLFAVFAIHPED